MDQWPKLRSMISEKLGDGVKVYYQPTTATRLTYPCVVCKLDDLPAIHADNLPYHWNHSYLVTVIDRDPMSVVREKIKELPTCRFTRFFVSDNLNHYVFRIYI